MLFAAVKVPPVACSGIPLEVPRQKMKKKQMFVLC